MSSPEAGDILDGRYRIDRPIARGGMSTVYRCVQLSLGREFAAKVLHDHLAEDPQFVQRFTREARAMARLSHPNLIDIHDFSDTSRPIFLIMDLITGGTLRELLAERGAMPAHAAAAVMHAVLSGLSAIHAQGLVHRDIKPDNILIDSDHQVKLGDFGLIRASAQRGQKNQIVGTVSYLSPEQVTGDEITAASDVYSAGVVLYELLTMETPFRGATQLEHARARLTQDVAAPSSRVDGVPKLFDALVATATDRNPQLRFADAAEFLAALDDVTAELKLPGFTVPIPQNSAAARTAAQPTDFTGSAQAPIFEATRDFSSADTVSHSPLAPVNEAADRDGDKAQAKTVTHTKETLFEQPGPSPERLSFESGNNQAGAPVPRYPAAPPMLSEPASTNGYNQTPHWPQPAVTPPAHDAVAESKQFYPEATTAEEEPEPAAVSNRSIILLILWITLAAACAGTIAIGGWWFGSGEYGGLPILWW